MSGYQPLPTSSLLEQKSRPEGDRASGVRGGGVGRVRKKERKGREVVSCRTLDEAHARCEAARAFTRGKQEAVCVPGRDTVGPGPGGVHAVLPAFEVSSRRQDWPAVDRAWPRGPGNSAAGSSRLQRGTNTSEK